MREKILAHSKEQSFPSTFSLFYTWVTGQVRIGDGMITFQRNIEAMELCGKFLSIVVQNIVFISQQDMRTFDKIKRGTKLLNSF